MVHWLCRDWTASQFLFSACVILLEAKSVTNLAPTLNSLGNVDDLIGAVEDDTENSPVESLEKRARLLILRWRRRNHSDLASLDHPTELSA